MLGRVLGLDWSQMNLNVFTHSPPTSSDYAGLPIMHAMDPINSVPISSVIPMPTNPKMDDRAALSRLYPVTAQKPGRLPREGTILRNRVRTMAVFSTKTTGSPHSP